MITKKIPVLQLFQDKMINYEYLKYWRQNMKEIRLTEILMKDNLIEYFRTKNIEQLEYLQNNIQELQRLREKTKEYYSKTFNQIPSNHPQDMNINKIKINTLKIKMFREVKKYPCTNKNRSIRAIIDLFKLPKLQIHQQNYIQQMIYSQSIILF